MKSFTDVRFVLATTVFALLLTSTGESWAVLGPTKASQLVNSTDYAPSTVADPCGGAAVEVQLSAAPLAGQVFVITGFSWRQSGVAANASVAVGLHRSNDMGGYIAVATSLAVANSAGVAVGYLTFQPGVVGLKGGDSFPHLCISQFTAGTLDNGADAGSLQGYIAKDK